METGDKVWLLWTGEYSDKSVLGVFTSEEGAELIRQHLANKKMELGKKCWGSEPELETYLESYRIEPEELDPAVEALRTGQKYWECSMWKDGSNAAATIEFEPDYGEEEELSNSYLIRAHRNMPPRSFNPVVLTDEMLVPYLAICAYVWAANEKEAIKITNEIRIQLLAANRFVEGARG